MHTRQQRRERSCIEKAGKPREPPGPVRTVQARGAGEHNCLPWFPSTWIDWSSFGPWPTCRVSQHLSNYIFWHLLPSDKGNKQGPQAVTAHSALPLPAGKAPRDGSRNKEILKQLKSGITEKALKWKSAYLDSRHLSITKH